MKTSHIVILNFIVALVVLAIAGTVAYYWYQGSRYVVTNDALVQGNLVPVLVAAPGTLSAWNVSVGDTVTAGQTLGTETVASGGHAVAVPITAPASGTVASVSVPTVGQQLVPGVPVTTLVDLSHLWVVANVPETQIRHVETGESADVWVDAYPGVMLSGTVAAIGGATQSAFSLVPNLNLSGTFTKVTQRIPVVIKLNGYAGYRLVPDESATVRIHIASGK